MSRLEEIKNSFVIFVVATYGEGDPTDNARELYEWLENDQNGLDNLKYVVSLVVFATTAQPTCLGIEKENLIFFDNYCFRYLVWVTRHMNIIT